ncbi:RluA family pseudouridine synthase [Marinicella sp. W31]|uniref:RluA family pseudouridine synthase n=1 Tax=Marinicella sp. W31 TaxID=3023713 RepID=UPI003756D33D
MLKKQTDFNILTFFKHEQHPLIVIDDQPPKKQPIFEVDASETGQRIDNLLLKKYKQLKKPQWYKLLRKGQVRVNGKRIKPLHKVVAGDKIRIPPSIFFVDQKAAPEIPQKVTGRLLDSIIFENASYVIIDKPAGMACHAGSGIFYGVVEVLQNCGRWPYIQLCHRLDKSTSGCLVLAKNREALAAFQKQLKDKTIDKEYVAVLQGLLTDSVVVDQALNTHHRVNGIRTVIVDAKGKPAKTTFEPLQATQQCSLVHCLIESGRTHQIRVHAAHIGHAVVGDPLYGEDEKPRMKGRQLYLHAQSIRFSDQNQTITGEAPVPSLFYQYVDL